MMWRCVLRKRTNERLLFPGLVCAAHWLVDASLLCCFFACRLRKHLPRLVTTMQALVSVLRLPCASRRCVCPVDAALLQSAAVRACGYRCHLFVLQYNIDVMMRDGLCCRCRRGNRRRAACCREECPVLRC